MSEITGTIKLTKEEAKIAKEALGFAADEAVLFDESNNIREVRNMHSELYNKINKRERQEEKDYDCTEQGHKWGDESIDNTLETLTIYKGCSMCPAIAYKIDGAQQWKVRDSYVDYRKETGSDKFNIGVSHE